MNTSLNSQVNSRNERFEPDRCNQCGTCFNLCPELQLPLPIAKAEIAALIAKSKSDYVLHNCTTCLGCNLFCPNQNFPYQLILENWNVAYKQDGAPPIYRFVIPTLHSNIWDMLYALMPKSDRDLVSKWMSTTPRDTILIVGNYTHLFPDLLGDSSIFKDLVLVDLLDHWEEGAYLYQGGYLDVVQEIGKKAAADFHKWGVKKIVTFLDAVHYLITNVQPTEMGNEYKAEVVTLNQWLLEQINSKRLVFKNNVGLKVTVHDNCYSKANGDVYWNDARRLIEMAGCTVVEMRHNRQNALCCGFGEGASWSKNFRLPFEILGTTKKKFEEAIETGADALVTYCTGCLYLLWAAKELFEYPIRLLHSIELVRMAAGEDLTVLEQAHHERAWDIISIISVHLFTSIFRKNFKITQIATEEPIRKKSHFLFLRSFRWLLSFNWIRRMFRAIFKKLVNRYQKRKDFR